jgi:hypothetical protein
MKYIAIFAAIGLSATAAHADPILVEAPKAPVSAEQAEAYVIKLERAVKEVCYQASAPLYGTNYYGYLSCLKKTRADVAQKDPTGLYAGGDSAKALVVAAK